MSGTGTATGLLALAERWEAESRELRREFAGDSNALAMLAGGHKEANLMDRLAAELRTACHEREAEFERLRSGAHTLGRMVMHMSRTMRAAQIEMRQNGPEKAMEWILNAIPDVDDNDPADHWNGTESAEEWLDRTEART